MVCLHSVHLSCMKSALKLPFLFDADRMLQELQSISDSFELIQNQYTGNTLEGMHLISPNLNGESNEKGETFHLTKELQECPYLQEVLNTFQCNKFTFRTQNLKAGGKIGKHNDGNKGLEHNIVRLNIPVRTNDEVYTYYNGERILMKSGECWLPNVIKDHEMENKSDETRWMLMMDCDLNDWWKAILKDFGYDLDHMSKHAYRSNEELASMKQNFLDMGLDSSSDLVKEVDAEIALRNKTIA